MRSNALLYIYTDICMYLSAASDFIVLYCEIKPGVVCVVVAESEMKGWSVHHNIPTPFHFNLRPLFIGGQSPPLPHSGRKFKWGPLLTRALTLTKGVPPSLPPSLSPAFPSFLPSLCKLCVNELGGGGGSTLTKVCSM
jgi:hypothetical protein